MPCAVLAAEVVLESVVASAEEAQPVPATSAGMCPQSRDISGGDHGEVKVLSEMVGHTIGAVDPGSAHWTSLRLTLSIHQVIDDERAIRLGEEFAETDCAYRRVAGFEVARALVKLIVLNQSASGSYRRNSATRSRWRISSISARRSSSRLAKYSEDSLVKLVCRNVPSTVVCTMHVISNLILSPTARRGKQPAGPRQVVQLG